ncbi:uncharacterized protein IUM83_12879 [Phytophthora cinnamomi]|uniref:uncharacterized protein n=1 Tax=Phytophthora cinnamomi TaxID=4785 RepID=UPI00355A1144|nr:hypothetical protein IUM83_12879 [Phytophthora cinnamomi]
MELVCRSCRFVPQPRRRTRAPRFGGETVDGSYMCATPIRSALDTLGEGWHYYLDRNTRRVKRNGESPQ